jgi:hypothetical protein
VLCVETREFRSGLHHVPVPEKTGKDDEVLEMLNAGQVLGFRSADDLAVLTANIAKQFDSEIGDWAANQ